jgi:hypothetical protein
MMNFSNKGGLFSIILLFSSTLTAQVPVSQEPLHRPALVNRYIRLLDVIVPAGDTTQFHIHQTPSLFVILSNNKTSSQIKGKDWIEDQSTAGTTWYRSFSPDILIHRVANLDTSPFHANDIEILSSFDSTNTRRKPLQFPVLFENEKSVAYQLKKQDLNKIEIRGRGPLIAELVTGDGVFFYNMNTKHHEELRAGRFFYIEPLTSFYFTSNGSSAINMILFEIK